MNSKFVPPFYNWLIKLSKNVTLYTIFFKQQTLHINTESIMRIDKGRGNNHKSRFGSTIKKDAEESQVR